jgi:chorismate synthase
MFATHKHYSQEGKQMQYITAGESHGPELTTIVSGVPAGLSVSIETINADLARRQRGYGRGGRQTIETDKAEVKSGIRFGKTTGAPIALTVKNRDWENWTERMAHFGAEPDGLKREVTPRPGHADLVGILKTNSDDCRNILERSSARETAARVAASGIAREFLAELGVEIFSFVKSIGSVSLPADYQAEALIGENRMLIEISDVRCPDEVTTEHMKSEIDAARAAGESLGGTFCVVATGLIPGLGSYTSGPERLTSKLGAAMFGIQAIKGVEFGLGFEGARRVGSKVHDGIVLEGSRFTRTSNNAGGLEGGMTNGMPLVITAAMKPIPTLMNPLKTVNIDTLEPHDASRERSDVCAVPAAAVVAEGEVAFVLANAYLEAFGCTCMADLKAAIAQYADRLDRMGR